jgi:enoyl-CoA hydratase
VSGQGASREVSIRLEGALGRITLERPAALNALTLAMVEAIRDALDAWRDEPAVKAVVVDGAGDRAFCAGGDIRMLYESGGADDGRAETFWREEYRLNQLIKRYPKPYVALIDGITMGGGMGLSVHGSFRVAGDRTLVAMPETGIGFYPDVGGTWFLPRLPGEAGAFMGLTGARLKAADALALGIATHYVPTDRRDALVAALTAADLDDAGGALEATLAAFEADAGDAPLAAHRPAIDRVFATDRVEDIVARLDTEGSEWASAQRKTLATKSPTSLKRTLRALREGADLEIEAALERELGFSLGCIEPGSDFYEGVRAVIVDKDNAPRWSPARLEAVTDAALDAFFDPARTRRIEFLAPSG